MEFLLDSLEGVIIVVLPVVAVLLFVYTKLKVSKIKYEENLFLSALVISTLCVSLTAGNLQAIIIVLLYMIPAILVYENYKIVISLMFMIFASVLICFDFAITPFMISGIVIINATAVLVVKKVKILTTLRILIYMVINVLYSFIFIASELFAASGINTIITVMIVWAIFWIIIVLNDTYKRYFELKRKFAYYQEVEKNYILGSQVAKVTHEIKNPIAVIKGHVDTFDIRDANKCKKSLKIIKNEIDRVLDIMNDYLCISNLRLHDVNFLDLEILVEDVINTMEKLALENSIKIMMVRPDFEPVIMGDYLRLKQVIINIIKNAIEAIENTGEIFVWFETHGEKVSVHFKDDGCGMSKETMDKMNELFYTTKLRGTGVGVTLIKEIINLHKGKVEYDSELYKGTVVKLEFKLEEF